MGIEFGYTGTLASDGLTPPAPRYEVKPKHHLCESLCACVEVTYGYLITLDLGGLVSYALKGVPLLLSGRANKESIFLICTLSARGITRDVYME